MKNSASFCLTLLASVCITTLSGQIVFQDRGKQCPAEIRGAYYQQALQVRKKYEGKNIRIKRFDILEAGQNTYLFPDGMFDVYEWVDSQWVNRYKGPFGGYNYDSKKFVWQDRIFSFGGYGFWHLHGQLIEFDFHEGGWEILPFSKDLPYGIGIPLGDSLRVLCEKPYIIDLNNKSIHKDNELAPNDYWVWPQDVTQRHATNRHVFHFTDHSMVRQPGLPWAIRMIRHHNGKQFERSGPLHAFNIHGFHRPKTQRSFYYLYKDSLIVSLMDEVILRADAKEEMEKFAPIESDGTNSRLPLLAISLLLMLPVAWFLYRNKFQKQPEAQENGSTDPYLEKLLELDMDTLDIPSMDRLLEIDHIKSDATLRYRRSKSIQKINQAYISSKGHPLVHRIRNPEDRRSFVYEIRR